LSFAVSAFFWFSDFFDKCFMPPKKKKPTNPFAFKARAERAGKKKTGKRIGKSKPEKANNQRNRIIR
jgi:hypothetical protein